MHHDAKQTLSIAIPKGNSAKVYTKLGTRPSTSDPYLMLPMKIQNEYFLTGGIDLFPIELANTLGDEVIVTYGAAYDGIENRAIENTFGYNPEVRLETAVKEKVYAWIDMSDFDRFDNESGFDPKVSLFSIDNAIPLDNDLFEQKNIRQWDYGKQRAMESLSHIGGDKSHIRTKI